jgi:MinD-like ATPase involved in chromosome partitioning or flagellar assembly
MPKRAFVPSDTGPALALPPPPEQGLPRRPDAEEQTPGEPVGEPRVPGAAELTDDTIVRRRSDRPTAGWRRVVHTVSGGVIDPGIGSVERRRQNLTLRIRRELGCPHKIAVTSIKGGVGKTTVAALLGLTLAEHRGDRVVALDANPDAGTLADRLTGEPGVTVRDLLDHIDGVDALPDVARFTSLAGRLQVLASEQDPARSEAFHRAEYEQVCAVLTRFYNIVITDSGTGMVHSAMDGTLAEADSLVVVGALTLDSASRASKTLDWLVAHGHRDLVARAVVVLSADRTSTELDTARLRSHFSARCRAVVDVPHDPHLATGGRIDMGALRPATADAILELTALVADEFGRSPTPRLP